MKLEIDIRPLDNLRKEISGFSERRLKAAVATALTRTARARRGNWTRQLSGKLDRPIARTVNAAGFTSATAAKLEATVFIKGGDLGTPGEYLRAQQMGGMRLLKKFEQALVSSGSMPEGYFTVPGQSAVRDSYGNVSRGQLVAVIRSLGQQYSPGYQQVISTSTARKLQSQARHGRKYVAVRPDEAGRAKVSPGIYERMADGSRKAIFLFKKSVTYKQRLNFTDSQSMKEVSLDLQREVDRSLQESLDRLAAKGQT